MKNIELKTCPNCHERIGIQDTECPYCKYIDDPKYKKHNEKLKKNKTNSKKKNDIYKPILLIPIVIYLIYLLLNVNIVLVIIPLILLNIVCFFTKKIFVLWCMIIELIIILCIFINNIYSMFLIDSFDKLNTHIIIFILGIIFIIIPKVIYVLKSKKKVKKGRKK